MKSEDLIILSIIVVILAVFVLAVLWYILDSIAHMKALRAMGYDNPWFAWIPVLSTYALADCIGGENADGVLFGTDIPMNIFKFWWLLSFILPYIPCVGVFLNLVWRVMCQGWVYTKMYAYIDRKEEKDVAVLGYISELIGIIPVVKFLLI